MRHKRRQGAGGRFQQEMLRLYREASWVDHRMDTNIILRSRQHSKSSFFLLLLSVSIIFGSVACEGDIASSVKDSTPVSSPNDAPQVESTQALTFAPAATPDTKLDDVKATVASAGLKGLTGKATDDSFYALIAKCGGAIPIRDGIIETMIPADLLVNRGGWYIISNDSVHPVKLQLIRGWKYTIEWSVLFQTRNGTWRNTASGSISDDCEVNTEILKRPEP